MPSSITFGRILVAPFAFGGCGLHAVTCLGGGRMLAILEEIGGPGGVYPQRIFRSADQGATWTELAYYPSAHNLWIWRAIGTAIDTALVGNEGPDQGGPAAPDDAIVRTTTAGATWAKAVEASFVRDYATSLWDMQGFVALDAGEIWSVGYILDDNGLGSFAEYNYIRSTNNGALFPTANRAQVPPAAGAAIPNLTSGAYIAPDILVLGGSITAKNARVWRSTNRGATWLEIVLPNTQHAAQGAATLGQISDVVYLGNSVVLACGNQPQAVGYFPPKLWRSTDSGATWSEITDSLPGWTPGTQVPAVRFANLGSGRVVLAVSGAPNNLGGTNWFLSEDSGATWAACTVSSYPAGAGTFLTIRDMAIADDGTLVVTAFPSAGNNEIWRGVLAGFSAAGPCATYAPAPPAPPPAPPAAAAVPPAQGAVTPSPGEPVWSVCGGWQDDPFGLCKIPRAADRPDPRLEGGEPEVPDFEGFAERPAAAAAPAAGWPWWLLMLLLLLAGRKTGRKTPSS